MKLLPQVQLAHGSRFLRVIARDEADRRSLLFGEVDLHLNAPARCLRRERSVARGPTVMLQRSF